MFYILKFRSIGGKTASIVQLYSTLCDANQALHLCQHLNSLKLGYKTLLGKSLVYKYDR